MQTAPLWSVDAPSTHQSYRRLHSLPFESITCPCLPFGNPLPGPWAQPLTHSCLQHSPALVMDSHHLHRQSWKRALGHVKHTPACRGAIPPCVPGVAQQEHTALRCLASPIITHCPAVTPELCFPQAQSSLGHKPSLTRVMGKHYRQRRIVPTGTDISRHRKATPADPT